jgi:hypothetical protein
MSTRFRFASSSPRDPGRTFFVPGVEPGEQERAYARLRDEVRAQTDRVPHPRRIFSLDCRLGGRDGQLAVGAPHPVGGADVLAIFDVGGEDRYAVLADGETGATRLGKHVYAVAEFA